jgi:hypothetical protein
MTTRFIGIKEFRQNISKIALNSKKNNQRLIVLNRNTPIFEVNPLSGEDQTLESLALGIQQGLADAKAGRVYTQAQVEKMLGL